MDATDPTLALILLAAGRSRRAGGAFKLLAERDGVPLVAHVAAALSRSRAGTRIVVLGHRAAEVRAAVAGVDAAAVFVEAFDHGDGLSASLRAGIAALPVDVEAVAICLADMPDVDGALVDRLFAARDPERGRDVVVATDGGERGNPVVLPRRLLAAIAGLTGDVGARRILVEAGAAVVAVEAGAAARHDLDTAEALAAAGFHPRVERRERHPTIGAITSSDGSV